MAAAKVTPDAINFMAQARARPDLSGHDARAARRSSRFRSRSSNNAARRDTAFCVSIDAQRRDEHRHLGRGPRANGAGRHRAGDEAARSGAARVTCFRCARATAACWCAPGTPRRPSIWRASPGSSPAGVICEIMNEDGTMARVPRADEVREEARTADDHDRRPDQVPHADRAARQARGDRPSCRRSTARSASSPTRTSSITRRTSRSSAATLATARTCSCACTRSA